MSSVRAEVERSASKQFAVSSDQGSEKSLLYREQKEETNVYPESILELKPSLPQVRDYPYSDSASVVSAPQARSPLVEYAAACARAGF